MTSGTVAEDWLHTMESTFGGLQVVPLSASHGEATGEFVSTDLGEVGIFEISGTPQRLVRSAGSLRRFPTESLKVCAVRQGRCTIEQAGLQVNVRPGEFGFYDTGRPYRLTWSGNWACDVMTVPPSAPGMPARAFREARDRTWSTSTGPGAILAQFMISCAAITEPAAPARDHLATAGASLFVGAISNNFDPALDLTEDIFRQQIELYIDRCLHHPELNLASIATAHDVSVRTIQRVFAGTGGVSGRIRRRRLEVIRRDLANPRYEWLTISEVAARWCFHDAQGLAKAFRAEFGMSPSEFRRYAAADSSVV